MKIFKNLNTKMAVGSLILLASSAHASGGASPDIWSAIDLSGIAVKVGGTGVVILGIAMALKSISLGKRTVNKV